MATAEMLQKHYLNYVNNFISVAAFAEYYCLDIDQAKLLIALGKKAHKRVLTKGRISTSPLFRWGN